MIIYCSEGGVEEEGGGFWLDSSKAGSSRSRRHNPCSRIPAVCFYSNWDGALKGGNERKEREGWREIMEDSLELQQRPCWPRSRLSGEDISRAIKGDDSRQAGRTDGERPCQLFAWMCRNHSRHVRRNLIPQRWYGSETPTTENFFRVLFFSFFARRE